MRGENIERVSSTRGARVARLRYAHEASSSLLMMLRERVNNGDHANAPRDIIDAMSALYTLAAAYFVV